MIKRPEITDRQRHFVELYVQTGGRNASACAIAAGYGVAGAGVAAHRLLKRDYIIDAIRLETERVFRANAPIAADAIFALAKDAKSESVRLQAAETWLNRAGMLLVNKSEHRHVIEDRRSDAELHEHIIRLARELGLSAKVIDGRVIPEIPALPVASPVETDPLAEPESRDFCADQACAEPVTQSDPPAEDPFS